MSEPKFEPTDAQRRQVETMSGYGIAQKDIAVTVGITKPTLHKYFREELDRGLAVANVNIGQTLYHMAVGRPAQFDEAGRLVREEVKPDKASAIFLSKARLGFKEISVHELTGPNGGPIMVQEVALDFSVFTDEEFTLFMRLYDKAQQRAAGEDDAAESAADV